MGTMAEEDRKFLSRWSRRKEEAREGGDAPADDPSTAEHDSGAAKGEAADLPEAAPDEAEILARLPDIDSLDENSDFSAFLAEGVPAAIRRRALRKLWRLNPIFANLDGLNDYDEDFTDAANVVEGVKTIYKVGKGMFDKDAPPEVPQEAPQEVAAEASTEPDEDDQETPESAEAGSPDPADVPPPPDPTETSSAEVAGDADPALASVTQHDDAPRAQKSGRLPGSAARRRWGDSAG
jgi:hypothetical protein